MANNVYANTKYAKEEQERMSSYGEDIWKQASAQSKLADQIKRYESQIGNRGAMDVAKTLQNTTRYANYLKQLQPVQQLSSQFTPELTQAMQPLLGSGLNLLNLNPNAINIKQGWQTTNQYDQNTLSSNIGYGLQRALKKGYVNTESLFGDVFNSLGSSKYGEANKKIIEGLGSQLDPLRQQYSEFAKQQALAQGFKQYTDAETGKTVYANEDYFKNSGDKDINKYIPTEAYEGFKQQYYAPVESYISQIAKQAADPNSSYWTDAKGQNRHMIGKGKTEEEYKQFFTDRMKEMTAKVLEAGQRLESGKSVNVESLRDNPFSKEYASSDSPVARELNNMYKNMVDAVLKAKGVSAFTTGSKAFYVKEGSKEAADFAKRENYSSGDFIKDDATLRVEREEKERAEKEARAAKEAENERKMQEALQRALDYKKAKAEATDVNKAISSSDLTSARDTASLAAEQAGQKRDLAKEQEALKEFDRIYGKMPDEMDDPTAAWEELHRIAYGGAPNKSFQRDLAAEQAAAQNISQMFKGQDFNNPEVKDNYFSAINRAVYGTSNPKFEGSVPAEGEAAAPATQNQAPQQQADIQMDQQNNMPVSNQGGMMENISSIFSGGEGGGMSKAEQNLSATNQLVMNLEKQLTDFKNQLDFEKINRLSGDVERAENLEDKIIDTENEPIPMTFINQQINEMGKEYSREEARRDRVEMLADATNVYKYNTKLAEYNLAIGRANEAQRMVEKEANDRKEYRELALREFEIKYNIQRDQMEDLRYANEQQWEKESQGYVPISQDNYDAMVKKYGEDKIYTDISGQSYLRPEPSMSELQMYEAKKQIDAMYQQGGMSELEMYEAKKMIDLQYQQEGELMKYEQFGGYESKQDFEQAKKKNNLTLDAINTVLNHPSLNAAVGFQLGTSMIPGTKAADFVSFYDNLKSLLTVENLGLMSGVLSETDVKILSQAASSLSRSQSEEAFKKELNKLKYSMTKVNNKLNRGNDYSFKSLADYYNSGAQENDEYYDDIVNYINSEGRNLNEGEILQIISSFGEPSFNSDPGMSVNGLGSLSKKYESGGDPGAIGYDSTGGKSYGIYQLAHGSASGFVKDFLKSVSPTLSKVFSAVAYGTKAFDNAWKNVATSNPDLFAQAQHAYIQKTHYDPQIKKLSSAGIQLDNYSNVLKDVIWSTAVQHGANTNIVMNSYNKLKKELGGIPDEKSLINEIYNQRWAGGANFKSSTDAVAKAVYNRFINEKNDALNKLT